MSEIDNILKDHENKMKQALEALKHHFSTLRTGRASSALVEDIKVDYYGSPTPLNQLATISCPEPKTITIDTWDKSAVSEVEKAIQASELGITPQNDGTLIRITLPELSQERRKDLVKLAHSKAEEIKVSVRNIRRDGNDKIKKQKGVDGVSEDDVKNYLEKMQKLTDQHIKKIDEILSAKEKEILTV